MFCMHKFNSVSGTCTCICIMYAVYLHISEDMVQNAYTLKLCEKFNEL